MFILLTIIKASKELNTTILIGSFYYNRLLLNEMMVFVYPYCIFASAIFTGIIIGKT